MKPYGVVWGLIMSNKALLGLLDASTRPSKGHLKAFPREDPTAFAFAVWAPRGSRGVPRRPLKALIPFRF